MKTPTKIVTGVIGIIIIGLAIWGQKPDETSATVVRFGYLPVVHALPMYVALEKGYFKDAGITAEVVKFEAPNQIIDALLSGQIDMSMSGATGITAVAESKKPGSLRVFAVAGGDSNHIADGLIVHKDSTVSAVEDLRGKKVGVLPGIQWHTLSRNLFAAYGLDAEKDLTLVELTIPLQIQALASKQVDALFTIEPVLTVAEAQGVSKNLLVSPNLVHVSNPFYAGVGNVSVDFMEKNPDTFNKVMVVLDKATKEIPDNLDIYREYFTLYTPLPAPLASVVNVPIFKMYTDMDDADFGAVQKFIDIFVKYGVMENTLTARELIIKE